LIFSEAQEIIEKNVKKFGFDDIFIEKLTQEIVSLIKASLLEDLDERGDITSEAILSDKESGEAIIVAKQNGIFSGGFLIEVIAKSVDSDIYLDVLVEEGQQLLELQTVSKIQGPIKSILMAERTILNFISRTSGISTLTSRFVELARPKGVIILDTRKTMPGWRYLDKYAVKAGGGENHRIGLFDMFLIKENHIVAAGGIMNAVKKCRQMAEKLGQNIPIEVETAQKKEVIEAIDAKVDRIMLDNMHPKEIKDVVELIKSTNDKIEIEISGGVNLENIDKYLQSGIDFISIGSLTHSVKGFDFSLLLNN
jgi:nicotinate-nucleotide pyrophosphorylase (carboxylating)